MSSATTLRESSARGRIWLVDDSPLEAEIVRAALAQTHDVNVYDHAAPVLEKLAAGERPDLLLLDWEMPDISGVDACRFARKSHHEGSLPIVILTVRQSAEDLAHALAAGANDFLHKPFNPPELVARVAAQLRVTRLHQRVAAAEAELRREASAREQFLAILAHDLRQPLGVFLVASERLGKGTIAETSRPILSARLGKAAGRMQRMIDDLLDFSRARPAGGVPLSPRAVDLAHVVDEIVGEVRLAHPDRAIEVSVSGDCAGQWDPDRLAQVVSNLVGNALAHATPETPIELSISCHPLAVELVVESRGATISPDHLPSLFEPFRRGASNAGKRQGLGLGLFIVAQIVKAHGGTTAAHSADGRTRFTVTLPRKHEGSSRHEA